MEVIVMLPLLYALWGRHRRGGVLSWVAAAELARQLAGLGAAWLVLAAGLAAVMVAGGAWMAAATAKAAATSARVDALVPAIANALPKSGGTITGDLHVNGVLYGTGGNLHVGDALTVDQNLTVHGSAGTDGALHVGGSVLTDTQLGFLSGLSQCPAMADWYLNDNFTGGTWGTGERDYVNVASSKGQALKNTLVSHGFIAP
jgi:hypothetical protein